MSVDDKQELPSREVTVSRDDMIAHVTAAVRELVGEKLLNGATILRFKTQSRNGKTELAPELYIAVYNKVRQAVIARVKETEKVEIGGNFDGNFNSVLAYVFEQMVQDALEKAFASS
jgi:hypothetical protein